VTAFLKARDNERGELLEYLTNSSIFAKIGQLAFEKTKEVRLQREKIESVLGHIELLSDEAIAELQSQFQAVQKNYQQLETEKFELNKQQQWFEQKYKIDSEISQKQQHHRTHNRLWHQIVYFWHNWKLLPKFVLWFFSNSKRKKICNSSNRKFCKSKVNLQP